MISALAFVLWSFRRIGSSDYGGSIIAALVLAGLCFGLAVLCKFNGLLGLMITASWCGALWLVPGLDIKQRMAMTLATMAAGLIAIVVATELNPFLTAHPKGKLAADARALWDKSPWDRFRFQVDHRFQLSNLQKQNFPNDALNTLGEKCAVVAVQGFGRFGPFGPGHSDSTVRFDPRQDWGAIVAVPLVMAGLVVACRRGVSQLRALKMPMSLAVTSWAFVAWIVVTLYLPMAWDRYMLPIQSGNALLIAMALSAAWDAVAARRNRHLEPGT